MKEINWNNVHRVLIVKLRSIGDTVLSTPCLFALKRHAPHLKVDVLLEDWVAPVLDGLDLVDKVVVLEKGLGNRVRTGMRLRQNRYDVAFNLHGGSTSTFLTRASGAKHRFGLGSYQYSFLHNHILSTPIEFWGRSDQHSAEQQLALLGFAGIPVRDAPKSRLAVTENALSSVLRKLPAAADKPFALMHPAAAFESKRWPVENYAAAAEALAAKGIATIAVASPNERTTLDDLTRMAHVEITAATDLELPEVTALASMAKVFVGNDSGIAHIAAAVGTPTVVIFGSSNRVHWRPWTDAPYEMVFKGMDCQPCAGYKCEVFGQPNCIRDIAVSDVMRAVEKVLEAAPVGMNAVS